MIPVKFKEMNGALTKPSDMTHEECGTLPVFRGDGMIISRWKGTFWSRIKFLFTGKVWINVWSNYSQPLIYIGIESPFGKGDKNED